MDDRSTRGAVSLEAAIALPVFFCVIVAIAFLLRVVQVHERVQHAISQASLEIAGISYAYGISGALDVQRDAEALVSRGLNNVEDAVAKSAQFENWLPEEASNEVSRQFANASAALTDRVNGALFSHYASSVTKKYLNTAASSADAGGPVGDSNPLRGANIGGGWNGLDFSGSTYLTNKQNEDDIWSLDNFTRGRRIREIFHANLPSNFPGIAAYSNGVATLIHSLDVTAASYQDPADIGRKLTAISRISGITRGKRNHMGAKG